MKAKRKSLKTIETPKAKNTPTPTKPWAFILIIIAIVLVASYAASSILMHFLPFGHPETNKTFSAPKDMQWFINRSSEASTLKIRISELDQEIKNFTDRHGPDQSTYTPQELEKYSSMTGARGIMIHSYDVIVAEYNLHRLEIDRNWNKSIPRAIYDIPE